MSKNITDLPYTEIVERAIELGRVREEVRNKVGGMVNDIYVRDIPQKEDWSFLVSRSTITLDAEYTTGSVSANTGGTTATFDSTVTMLSSFTGRRLKIGGNDYVYDATFQGTTALTISPPLSGTENASGQSYSLFRTSYPLASDFDRFPKNGGAYKWSGGKKEIISEESYQEATSLFQASPTDNPDKVRLVGSDTAGRQQFEFRPAPKSARVYGCDYLKKVSPLSETSAGTVTISANGTIVTGDNSCRFQEASVGDYIRVNAFGMSQDSTWYRVNSIAHNSSLTIATVFASSGVVSADYIISKVPEFPAKLHPGLIYGASRLITVDQNDPNAALHISRYAEVLSDGKRIYVTRVYNQVVDTIATEFRYRV